MGAPHAGFIFAAYAVTFVAIGTTIATVVLRHRALKRALSKFPDSEQRLP